MPEDQLKVVEDVLWVEGVPKAPENVFKVAGGVPAAPRGRARGATGLLEDSTGHSKGAGG